MKTHKDEKGNLCIACQDCEFGFKGNKSCPVGSTEMAEYLNRGCTTGTLKTNNNSKEQKNDTLF